MNVSLWVAPAAPAGLFVVLWASTWLERLVAPPALARPIRPTAEVDHSEAALGPEGARATGSPPGGLGPPST